MHAQIERAGRAAMDHWATVILATRDSGLASALEREHPDVRFLEIGTEPLKDRVAGQLWCFIDWLLPAISGLEICRRLRESPKTALSHITMVLDEDDSEIRRRALRAGADNYIRGPLTHEIVAAQLQEGRKAGASNLAQRRLSHGALVLDHAAHQVRYCNRVIPLRPNEFSLLAHFIEHPDRLFTRSQVIAMLGKNCDVLDERTVDVWVGRLRRSLKSHGVPEQLRTVRSMGYVLDSVMEFEGSHAA